MSKPNYREVLEHLVDDNLGEDGKEVDVTSARLVTMGAVTAGEFALIAAANQRADVFGLSVGVATATVALIEARRRYLGR